MVAIGSGAPMARQVLDDRQNPAALQPRRQRRRDHGDLVRRIAKGAIADHPVGAGDRHIGQRKAIDRDPRRGEIGGDKAFDL